MPYKSRIEVEDVVAARQSSARFFGVVYLLTNRITGKVYIGKTQSDIVSYLSRKFSRKGLKTLLYRALYKYGAGSFKCKVIATADNIAELNQKEIAAISTYQSRDKKIGYNLSAGGDGGSVISGFKGHRHTAKTRVQMSRSSRHIDPFKEKPRSQEMLSSISAKLKGRPSYWKGRKRPLEFGIKVSNAHKGKVKSELHRLNLSNAAKTMWERKRQAEAIGKTNVNVLKS